MHIQLKNFNKAKESLLEQIRLLREQKGKEKQILALINKSLKEGQDFVIELLWEEALIHQHSYMSKPTSEALEKMEGSIKTAGYFIQKFGLKNYISRLERYLGRLNDYKGNFKDSVKNYKKAIKYARLGPFYLSEGKPIWLELEGFLSCALLMSGAVEAGLSMAQKAYQKFEEKEGRQLKARDYPTWAIWRTGIAIRTAEGLINLGVDFDKKDMLSWLNKAEKLIQKPVSSKKWGGKVDFSFRKEEFRKVRKMLS